MKQKSFFKPSRRYREHGGSLSVGRRRSRRPLSTKEPIHLTLRSDLARGQRSLLRHRPLIEKTLKKASARFGVRVYEKAICGNHLHLLVYGKTRLGLQNFFRVVAGHIAQGILDKIPLTSRDLSIAGGAPRKQLGHPKNQRKFWALLVYTRLMTWGREFRVVQRYIIQNTLEALNIIAYRPRTARGLNTS